MNYNEIPSLTKVKKAIEKFKNLDWPQYENEQDINKFVDDFSKIITAELGIFLNFLMPLKHSDFKFGIFRAREVDTFNDINLFTEHSYPPPSVTKFGRCNFPNHPVFYSSNNPVTALIEVVRNGNVAGKRFCISSWKISDPDETLIFENFLQSDLHPGNNFGILAKAAIEKIGEPFENTLSKAKKSAIIEFMKFVDTQFIDDQSYSFSAALAHRRLYANDNYSTDILLYPSVQSNKQGVNLAISPNFVDNHLQLQRCYIAELNHYDIGTGNFNMTFSKYGEVMKNKLIWKKLDPNDKDYQTYFKEDFQDFLNPEYKLDFLTKDTAANSR